MPLNPGSGVTCGSRSSIYGSGMASKPAAPAARPATGPSGGAFIAGGVGKVFTAPVSKRDAAEARITRHGTGNTVVQPPTTFENGVHAAPSQQMAVPTLRAHGAATNRLGQPPDSVGALLYQGAGAFPPPSPSCFTRPQTPQTPQYAQHAKHQKNQQQQHHQHQHQQSQPQPPPPAPPQQPTMQQNAPPMSVQQLLLAQQVRQQQWQQSQQSRQSQQLSGIYTVSSLTPRGSADDLSRTAADGASRVAADEASRAAPAAPAERVQNLPAAPMAVATERPMLLAAPPAAAPPVAPPPAPAAFAHAPPPPPPALVPAAPAPLPPPPPESNVPLQPKHAPPQPIDPANAQLGKGVFARVRMTHGRDGQIIAVKTYDHKEARAEKAVAKHMLNEERLAGRIQHENIIAPTLARRKIGCTELEMEYAPGGTLEAHVKKLGRPLTEAEAANYFRQIVDAVVYLHGEGITHRDIKLENVVLDAEGNARLVDFGAAREVGADTFLMSVQGTPAYMAPEVATQRAHKGGPADVWALGVLLYNLLSGGAYPFWGKNMDELRRNITAAPPRIPSHLSPACRELLEKLLNKSSANRISAAEVRASKWLRAFDAPSDMPVGSCGVDPANAATAAPGAATAPPSTPRDRIAAAAEAEAAAVRERYRAGHACSKLEVEAARAAAAARLHLGASPASSPRAAPAPVVPPYAANYMQRPASAAAGRPSSGVAAPAVPPPLGAPGAMTSPRSASKLANLMNGNGRPGTPQGPPAAGMTQGAGMTRATSAHNLGLGFGTRR